MQRCQRFSASWVLVGSVLTLAVLLVFTAPARAGVVVVLGAEIDNTMYEESGDRSNGQGPHLYAGRNAGFSARRALMRFDVSGIPSYATILSVELSLDANHVAPGAVVATHTLHRVTAEWGEGASDAGEPGGLGTVAEPGDATWLFRLWPTDAWASAGGDFEAAVSASQDIGAAGAYMFSGQGLIDDVAAWVDGSVPNFGWVLRGDESTSVTAKRFGSSENAAGGPSLAITYEEPSTPVEQKSWSSLKGSFGE
jgi:hypothetical protein